jgi:hypothetical protein
MVAFEKKKHVIPRLTRLGGHSQLDITTAIGGGFLLRTKFFQNF